MNNIINVSSPIERELSVRSTYNANRRVTNFMGHAIEMLSQLKEQNRNAYGFDPVREAQLNKIYGQGEEKIYALNNKIMSRISQRSPERAAEIGQLQKKLKAAQKEIEQNQAEIDRLADELYKIAEAEGNVKTLQVRLNKAIERQNRSYDKADSLQKQLDDVVSNLSKKEVKDLKQQLKAAEKEIVKIIRETQIEVAAEIGAEESKGWVASGWITNKDLPTVKDKVATLARGGWGATWIHFLASVSKVNAFAIAAFKASENAMTNASLRVPAPTKADQESQVEKDKRAEFKVSRKNGDQLLARRAGVIGLNGIYRFQVAFSEKEIHKQFKSFVAQNISRLERTTIEREIEMEGKSFTSKIIPLNKEFDKYMGLSGILTAAFTLLFGTRGISSANRQEPHLINGWETNLIQNDKTIFRALRHAILSDKYEKDSAVRVENSRKAAEELIKAALLEEIKTQGLTIEEAKEQGITLNLNSISLVTPDSIRPHLPNQANERKMLLDQVSALRSFNGMNHIELDGVKIWVTVNANAFNFGVNALADTYKRGLAHQYEHNLKAMLGFQQHFERFNEEMRTEMASITAQLRKLNPSTQDAQYDGLLARRRTLEKEQEKASLLMHDIELLMKDKKAYLKGDNQYEIGAKILNLNSLMDQNIETINKTRAPKDRISGFKGAFNCMSGKDRTGWMDAVAKTFAIMAESNNGYYPSHAAFMEDPKLRQKFAEILEKVVLEAGNLEITEINTGAKGYKVQGEACLFGMPAETFLQAQGLSSTTAS